MRKERMTENEYIEAKQAIEKIKAEIKRLRTKKNELIKKEIERINKEIRAETKKLVEEKNKLIKKVNWYDYTEGTLSQDYENGFSYKYFGKRYKDLTKEERKEYNKIWQRISRSKKCKNKGD